MKEYYEEIKLLREQNKVLKTRMYDEEKKGREVHSKII